MKIKNAKDARISIFQALLIVCAAILAAYLVGLLWLTVTLVAWITIVSLIALVMIAILIYKIRTLK